MFRVELDAAEHGEQFRLVVVVHLDFGNVGALPGDMVNDRIGQAGMIGTNGGDGDLHGAE